MSEIAERIIEEFLKHGVTGAVALIALYGFWKKDRETKAVYEMVIAQQEKYHLSYQNLLREFDSTLDTAIRAIDRD